MDEQRRLQFGRYLRERREALLLSQEEMAERLSTVLGVTRTQAYVSLWERGEQRTYTPADLRAWAVVLERPVIEVLARCGFLTPSEVLTDDVARALPVDPDMIALMRLPSDLAPEEAEWVAEMIAAFRRWQTEQARLQKREPPDTRHA